MYLSSGNCYRSRSLSLKKHTAKAFEKGPHKGPAAQRRRRLAIGNRVAPRRQETFIKTHNGVCKPEWQHRRPSGLELNTDTQIYIYKENPRLFSNGRLDHKRLNLVEHA